MISFPQASPPIPCAPLYPPPYAPHALPISFVSIFTTRTILGKEYRSFSSSLCSFLHSPVSPLATTEWKRVFPEDITPSVYGAIAPSRPRSPSKGASTLLYPQPHGYHLVSKYNAISCCDACSRHCLNVGHATTIGNTQLGVTAHRSQTSLCLLVELIFQWQKKSLKHRHSWASHSCSATRRKCLLCNSSNSIICSRQANRLTVQNQRTTLQSFKCLYAKTGVYMLKSPWQLTLKLSTQGACHQSSVSEITNFSPCSV